VLTDGSDNTAFDGRWEERCAAGGIDETFARRNNGDEGAGLDLTSPSRNSNCNKALRMDPSSSASGVGSFKSEDSNAPKSPRDCFSAAIRNNGAHGASFLASESLGSEAVAVLSKILLRRALRDMRCELRPSI
jgi:hypothetical protein